MGNLQDELNQAEAIEAALYLEMEREDQLSALSNFRHKLYKVTSWNADSRIPTSDTRTPEDDLSQANLISSEIDGEPGMHTVMLDLDVPACLVPSSTPGHFHLYIDVKLAWEKYGPLLKALRDATIIEDGYYQASVRRGCTSLRLPWIKRKDRRRE